MTGMTYQNSRNQKEDSSQERESHVGLVLSTLVSLRNIAPSPDRSACIIAVEVSEESERYDPEDEEDEVDWPFGEGGEEWKEEEEREEDGDGGDGDGVDVSLVSGSFGTAALVKIFTSETSDGSAEGEFADAEEKGDEVCGEHFVRCKEVR